MSNNIDVKEFGAKVMALKEESDTSLQRHRKEMRKFWVKNAKSLYQHAQDDRNMTRELDKLFKKYPDVYKRQNDRM